MGTLPYLTKEPPHADNAAGSHDQRLPAGCADESPMCQVNAVPHSRFKSVYKPRGQKVPKAMVNTVLGARHKQRVRVGWPEPLHTKDNQ